MKKKSSGLDRTVILTFILFSLAGSGIAGYKFLTYKDCSKITFDIKAEDFIAGEIISFSSQSPASSKLRWNFGDTTAVSAERAPVHIYKHPGEYQVKMNTDNGCECIKKIAILPRPEIKIYPVFYGPSEVTVGTPVQFRDSTKYAYTWEWNFGESTASVSNEKSPVYTFRTTGTKIVSMMVNGRKESMVTQRIEVKEAAAPAPVLPSHTPAPAPVAPLPPISKERVKKLMLEILNDAGSDKAHMHIDTLQRYSCDPKRLNVMAARTNVYPKKRITLKELHHEIKTGNRSHFTIGRFDVTKDTATNCIKEITLHFTGSKLGKKK